MNGFGDELLKSPRKYFWPVDIPGEFPTSFEENPPDQQQPQKAVQLCSSTYLSLVPVGSSEHAGGGLDRRQLIRVRLHFDARVVPKGQHDVDQLEKTRLLVSVDTRLVKQIWMKAITLFGSQEKQSSEMLRDSVIIKTDGEQLNWRICSTKRKEMDTHN